MDTTSAVQLFQRLFRGAPERHLLWVPGPDLNQKQIVTRPWRARTQEYEVHLAPDTRAGPGALGLFPGFPRQDREGLWTDWAMLDFDSQSPDDLQDLFEALSRQGLQVLANTGSRGRGTHLWFLLGRPLPLAHVVASLQFLQRVVRALELGKVELRPVAGAGAGVLLPYRGARLDGEGVNPLVDHQTGEVLSLQALAERERQDHRRFAQLGRLRSPERFLTGTYRPAGALQPRLESVLEERTQEDRWEAELERLESFWEEGRRHYLVIGATVHGLNCGVAPEVIEEELMDLVDRCGDEEAQERRKAIRDTLRRHKRGLTVSASHFYDRAGVEPPSKVSQEVQDLVVSLLDEMMGDPWLTQKGKSARSLYRALLRLAWHHGRQHPLGVEVSVSRSQLLEEAALGSAATVESALVHLEGKNLLRRGAASVRDRSGSFVLLTAECSTHITGEKVRGYFSLSPHLRNGRDRLGKTAEQLLDLLLYHGPQDLTELAQRMKTRPSDLRKHTNTLFRSSIIEFGEGQCLQTTADFKKALDDRAHIDGSHQARERQQQYLRVRQTAFQARLRRQDEQRREVGSPQVSTPSAEEEAPTGPRDK